MRGAYRYNGLGQRVEKTTGGVSVRFIYGINGELLSELDSAGNPQRDYVAVDGEPLAVITYTVQQSGLGTVIDNGEAGASSTGTWTTTTDNKNTRWGSDYLEAAGGTGSTYRWTPSLSAGTYSVYTWYADDNKAATQVPYTLVHNGVTDVVNIDQTTSGGQWVLLGTYTFSGDGTEYVEVSDANGKTLVDALRFDPQGLPPQLLADVRYVHTDQLATPRAITDSSGSVVWRWESDPFGTTAANEDPDGDGNGFTYNPRFAGQYYDGETGLHYNYFRDYDPATGRYIESDPIGLKGGYNTYTYVLGNPLRYVDLLGLCGCKNSSKTYPDGAPDFEPWFWQTYDGTMRCSYNCKDDNGKAFTITVTVTEHRGWFDDPNLKFVCPHVNVYYEELYTPPWRRQAWDTPEFDPRTSSNPDIKRQGEENCKSCKQ